MRYKMTSPLRRKAARKIGKYAAKRIVQYETDIASLGYDDYHNEVSKLWDEIEGFVLNDIKHYTHQALRKERN